VAPHFGANACGIAERAIVDEIDAARALSPVAGLNAAAYGVASQTASFGLLKGDDAVVSSQIVVEHTRIDGSTPAAVPILRGLCAVCRGQRNEVHKSRA
jgi:hypothetical protein